MKRYSHDEIKEFNANIIRGTNVDLGKIKDILKQYLELLDGKQAALSAPRTHTPGPWKPYRAYDFSPIHIQDDHDYTICTMSEWDKLPNIANAKLIAMAPEMLLALEKIKDLFWHKEELDVEIYQGEIQDYITKIICKAKGGA